MAVDVGSAVGYLDLDISGFLQNWNKAQHEADTASKNIATKIGNNLSSAGKGLQSAGSTLTKTATTPVLGIGTAAIKVTADFDSAMSKVSAISGATGGDLDRLRDKAKEMGAETKFSATESAEAFTYMAMAGWKTEDMLAGISGIMSLAAADGLDLATTSDIVTDALTAFGLSAADSGHFADVLAVASSNANTNVSMLGESFKYVAPVAGALGYSAEDTAIALGLMANAGIKGSQGGTALRSSLSKLVKPTDDAAAVMQKYGISMTNTDGSMKSLGDVMGNLRSSLGGLTEAEQAQVAATLFGQEAMSGMLAIINASESDYAKLTDAIYDADGAAQKMADTMLDNLNGQLTLLKSALEGLAIEIGEILMPHITNFVSKIQDLVAWFGSLSTEQKEQIVKWAGIAAAIGPVLVVVGKLVSSFGGLFSTFGKLVDWVGKVSKGTSGLSSVFKVMSTHAGAITGVIAILAAAFATLWQNNEQFREKMTAIWNQLRDSISEFVGSVGSRMEGLKQAFQNIINFVTPLWNGFCELLGPVFIGAFELAVDTLQGIFDTIIGILDIFVGVFTGDWDLAWSGVKEVFGAVWSWIVNTFNNVCTTLTGILDAICGWFGTTWESTWSGIKDFFVNAWNSVIEFLSTTWETIKNIVQVGIMFIVELLSAAFQLITLPFAFIWENCKDTIVSVWDAIKSTISKVLSVISNLISNVWNSVKNTFTTVWNAISSTVTTVWNNIKTTVANALNNVKTTVSSAVDNVKSKIATGFNTAKSTVSSVLDSIKSKFTSIWNNCTSIVSNAISKLKSVMNFSWSLPKLKLPHLSISGRFSINPPSVPHFSISWYKSAMESGMILNSPTLFGYNAATGKFLGAGEAGSETVVGTKSLLSMIKSTVAESNNEILKSIEMHFEALRDNFDKSSERLVAILAQLLESSAKYTGAIEGIGSIDSFGGGDGFDYIKLAAALADEFRNAPVQHNVNVEMEDGDVFLDNERVGRKVAPVVSRVVSQGT